MGTIKVSNYLINFLIDKKIDKVFGYIGGAVAHIYDSIDKNNKIEIINCINEQAAGFAAEGYARINNLPGVAIATSGPGATNLITAIGSCFFDSIPSIFITGQVNTYEYKYQNKIRQLGFQETDIVNIVKPIVKYSVMIDNIKKIRYEIEKAYFLSLHARKGPVLIDIPMDIQRSEIDIESLESFYDSSEYKQMILQNKLDEKIHNVSKLLNDSKRPIFLLGGGIRLSGSTKTLQNFIYKHNFPIVYSLMGKDCICDTYTYNMGLIGAYGNRYSNLSLANSDLIVVLGSRLDTRQTGTNLKTFAREAKIIHVDIDRNELDFKNTTFLKIHCDIKDFLETIKYIKINVNLSDWHNKLLLYKQKFSSLYDLNKNPKEPNLIIKKISSFAKYEPVCVDVGQHQMWVAQSFENHENQRILFSGGMGAMGFALPCSIGVSIASQKRTIVISGDGGFQMNIQELETIKRRNLPIKIFILNNQNLGMVRQFQEIYFNKNYIGTIKDYSVPDLCLIANAYGIKSRNIVDLKNFKNELKNIFSNNEPELINIKLNSQFTTVEPKLIVNKPIEDMYPFLTKETLHSLMIIKPLKEQ